jgi:polyribonucleotide 5'-hydroxyl-kinase
MITYANLHYALERLRDQASTDRKDGPRVLVLGPENAGKTSLVKLLTAYATRSGRQPVVVNLDIKEGMLSIPGTLSASTFSSILDVEEGWGSSPTNGPNQVPVKLPLVYYYGLANPEESPHILKPIITRLALSVMSKLQDDIEAKETGCIIDTAGAISQGKRGYDVIQHVVSEFSGNLSSQSSIRFNPN